MWLKEKGADGGSWETGIDTCAITAAKVVNSSEGGLLCGTGSSI